MAGAAPISSKADDGFALIYICDAAVVPCTASSARAWFRVPVESLIPSGCLMQLQAQVAQTGLLGEKETLKVSCPK